MNEATRLAFEFHIIVALRVAVFGGILLGVITTRMSKGTRLTWPMLWVVRLLQYLPSYSPLSSRTADKMESSSYSPTSQLLASIGSWFIILFLAGVLVAAVWP